MAYLRIYRLLIAYQGAVADSWDRGNQSYCIKSKSPATGVCARDVIVKFMKVTVSVMKVTVSGRFHVPPRALWENVGAAWQCVGKQQVTGRHHCMTGWYRYRTSDCWGHLSTW